MSDTKKPTTLIVCVNRRFDPGRPSCAARGSFDIARALEKGIAERNIDIQVEQICCLGHCAKGPAMRLAPGGAFYHGTSLTDVPDILDDLAAKCGSLKPSRAGP